MTTTKKLRVAIAGQWEEVNTFTVETMGLATITGNMATGFQKFEGKQILDQFKSRATCGAMTGVAIDEVVKDAKSGVPAIGYALPGVVNNLTFTIVALVLIAIL